MHIFLMRAEQGGKEGMEKINFYVVDINWQPFLVISVTEKVDLECK